MIEANSTEKTAQGYINSQPIPGPHQPEADSGHNYTAVIPNATTGSEFGEAVMGPATLSVAVSQIAVDKATDAATKQFANFELREAIAVTTILNSMNIATPTMSAEGRMLLQNLKMSPMGVDFDRTYIGAQLANHEFLRDLAEVYLKSEDNNKADPTELHARNLAELALTAFKEHIVLAKNIAAALAD